MVEISIRIPLGGIVKWFHVACFEGNHVEAPLDALIDTNYERKERKRFIDLSLFIFYYGQNTLFLV